MVASIRLQQLQFIKILQFKLLLRLTRFPICINLESNLVANILAREVEDQPHVWVEDPPSFIIQCLIDNVIVI